MNSEDLKLYFNSCLLIYEIYTNRDNYILSINYRKKFFGIIIFLKYYSEIDKIVESYLWSFAATRFTTAIKKESKNK